MRRLIAYITMALTMLIAVGVTFVPVFTGMNANREYSSGTEIVYQIDTSDGDLTNNDAITKIANEMSYRLNQYSIDDYSVRIEGTDTVRVSFATQDKTKENNIVQYLNFSGQNFSIATSNEETRLTQDEVFDNSKAYIVYEGVAPYVIIPVSDTVKMQQLIDTADNVDGAPGDTTGGKSVLRANEEDAAATPNIFLWANWEEGDDIEKAQEDVDGIGKKVIASFVSSNIWYPDSAEEDTEIMYLCGYADETGAYDTTKIKEANELAIKVRNFFNASEYEYEVNFLYQQTVPATVENLTVLGMQNNLALSVTLISIIVAIFILGAFLVLFYRLGAIAMFTNAIVTTFLTYVVFISIGSIFNISALVGGFVVLAASTALSIYYLNKFKEEVYKGRSFKKANQEASKKFILPTIDVAVILAVVGLMTFLIGGDLLRSFGVMAFFGGAFIIAMNLIIFKIMMYLLSNTTSLSNNFKTLNIESKKVPNLMLEEKPSFNGPFENSDFTKKRKSVLIGSASVGVLSLVMMCVFGLLNGSVINNNYMFSESTQVYVSLTMETPTITDSEYFEQNILENITYDGEKLIDLYSNVEHGTNSEYDYETDITTNYNYYVTSFNAVYSEEDLGFSYTYENATYSNLNLEEAIHGLVGKTEGTTSDAYLNVSSKTGFETVEQPSLLFVAIATLVGLVISCLYIAFRYRLSRAIAVLLFSSLSVFLSLGFFSIIQIQTTSMIAIALPMIATLSVVASLFFLIKEKEMLKDVKTSNLTKEMRKEIMIKASSYCAGPLFVFTAIFSFLSVTFFGFNPNAFATLFATLLIGLLLSALFITTMVGPCAQYLEKFKINFEFKSKSKKEKKHRIKLQSHKNSSEPEETIFIGIND